MSNIRRIRRVNFCLDFNGSNTGTNSLTCINSNSTVSGFGYYYNYSISIYDPNKTVVILDIANSSSYMVNLKSITSNYISLYYSTSSRAVVHISMQVIEFY